MRNTLFFLAIFISIFLVNACNKEGDDKEDDMVQVIDTLVINMDSIPFSKLSSYGFFEGDLKDLEPHEALIPYNLNTALFSNYATKQRFVYVPLGEKVNYQSNEQETLEFPEGSIIIKSFYYQNDFTDLAAGKRILETRLLIRKEGEWEAAEYIWNDDQTEADYKIAGGQIDVSWIHYDGSTRSTLYSIPNNNECKGCHELGSDMVLIGPKARYLNKDFDYKEGTMNQLEKWEILGVLEGLPDFAEVPKAGTWGNENESLNDRARAYLDINCAHCHNAQGPANNSGLFLDFYQADSSKLGFCKGPVAAGGGSGNLDYSIAPGDPDASIMIYRLNSLEPDESMPELARSVVHEEGLQLLRDWISSIEGECN